MHFRRLGRTGLKISQLGHGTWGMGDWTGTNLDAAVASLRKSVELGVTFFDTAHSYGGGLAEELLGCLLFETPNDPLVIATKIPPANHRLPATGDDRFADTFPPEHVRACVQESCERIGIESLDLAQLHVWHDAWVDDPLFESVVRLIKGEGWARHVGISLNAGEPSNGLRAVRSGLIDTVQVAYNLLDQTAQLELLPLCQELNIGVIVRTPLDEGCLADNFDHQTHFPADDWRATYFSGAGHIERLERLADLRRAIGPELALSDIALQFCLAHPAVSTVIVGMRNEKHVMRNCMACETPIDFELLKRLGR